MVSGSGLRASPIRRAAALGLVIVLLLGLAVVVSRVVRAVADQDGPRLVVPDSTTGQSMASDGDYATFIIGDVCLTEAGTATITGVEPLRSVNGAELTDFVVFPWSQLGSRPAGDVERLRQLAQFDGVETVTEICEPSTPVESQLAVEIHDPGTAQGGVFADGLRVSYSLGDHDGEVELHYQVGLCPLTDTSCDIGQLASEEG